jgi:hypothetical protein
MIDLKTETAKRLESKLDISSDVTFVLFDIGLIDERTAKRFLVKDDYESQYPPKGLKEETTIHIADDFCVSLETAKRYITGRHK